MKRIRLIPFKLDYVTAVEVMKDQEIPGSGSRWKRRFRWQYMENPALEAEDQIGWVLVDERDRLVGCIMSMAERFKIFNEEMTLGISCDTIVHKDFRRLGLSQRLRLEYFRTQGKYIALSTSPVPLIIRSWEKLGGSVVPGSNKHYVAVLNPTALIEAKIKRIWGKTAATILGSPASHLFKFVKRSLDWGDPLDRIVVETVFSTDPRLEILWKEVNEQYLITSVRDQKFMHWRHGLGGSSILLFSWRTGGPICWAAYVESPRTAAFGTRRARVLDIFGRMDNFSACTEALKAFLLHLSSTGFDAADFKGLNPRWQRALIEIGLFQGDLANPFVYRAPLLDKKGSTSAESWHIGLADGDSGFWDMPNFPPNMETPSQ